MIEGPQRRLVILRALGLGDLLTAVPAIRGVRNSWPQHQLLLAAPRWLSPVASLIGCVDRVIDTAPLQPPRVREPDVAVNLHGRGPQSHRALVSTRPRTLIAFEHRSIGETHGCPRWRPDEHEVRRWCRLLSELGHPSDPEDLAIAVPDRELPPRWKGATVIHPGASSGARRWPADRWAAVARSAFERRPVVITGSDREVPVARRIASLAGLPGDSVAAGRTDLFSLAALVAGAACVVSGDTGVAHLAVAYGTPSVVLFGPISPALWGPPDGRPQHRVLYKGGRGDPHGLTADPGLLEIEVDEVSEALMMLDSLELGMGTTGTQVQSTIRPMMKAR